MAKSTRQIHQRNAESGWNLCIWGRSGPSVRVQMGALRRDGFSSCALRESAVSNFFLDTLAQVPIGPKVDTYRTSQIDTVRRFNIHDFLSTSKCTSFYGPLR